MAPVTLEDLSLLSFRIAQSEGWSYTPAEEEAIYGPPPARYDEYVYFLETRPDPEAQADLEHHDMLWPTGYGCPEDPGFSL